MPDVLDFCRVRVGCPIETSDNSHIGNVLDLSLGTSGFDSSQEVVLK